METIKDFFKEFKDRLSNPLIASFLISWLIINWPIIVALFFYKHNEVKLDGFNSYIHVIDRHISLRKMFVLPMIYSLLYTFFFPYLKSFIKESHAKINSNSESKILKISKEGYVSVAKHMELKERYEENIQKITQFFDNDYKIQQENLELKAEILKVKNDYTELEKKKVAPQPTQSYNLFNDFDGNWSAIYRRDKRLVGEKIWSIIGNSVTIHGDNFGNTIDSNHIIASGTYQIEQYVSDSARHSAAFLLRHIENSYFFYFITEESFDRYSGIENASYEVEFSRLSK